MSKTAALNALAASLGAHWSGMTVTFDTTLLTAYYNAKSGVGANASGGTTKTVAKTPTPPWSTESKAPRSNDLVKSVLAGHRFVDTSAAKLDVASAPEDYKKLFALYQGLNALQGLSDQVASKGVSEAEKTRLRARFNEGMAEISKFVDESDFDMFKLAQGQAAAKLTTNAGVRVETDAYTTGTLWTGPASGLPPAFQGNVAFSLSVKRGTATIPVAIDLNEMGATPRTMSNVVIYLNDKLAAAGVTTRFVNQRTPGADKTVQVGGKPVVIGQEADSYALKIKGDSTEILTFSAPATAPSGYLAGGVGRDTDKADPTLQLTKLEGGAADLAGAGANGKVFAKGFDAGVSAVRAQTVAADGSLYVLAEVDGPVDGQSIKGASDVALMKYDPAGNLVYTRTLGASTGASGYALSVSADGQSIAVAGSVTGVLDLGDAGKDASAADSFVSVFTAAGEEKWTQRSGAAATDKATGVAFAADGSVYVTGTTSSAMPGAAAAGGQDAYLRGYSAAGSVKFTTQYGTAGTDSSAGLVVDGNSVLVAGVESNSAVLRRFDLQPAGAPTLAATRNLGALTGGSIAGIGLMADGSVVVAGSTTNGALSVGTTTTGYPGQQAAFVARLAGDLSVSGTDRLTYLAGSAARTASAMTVSNGQVYLAGQVSVTPPAGETTAHDGYVQAIDPLTGAVSWSRQIQGADREAGFSALAVSQTGTSVLDKLGLPQGSIDWSVSKTLAANSSVRVGDQFAIRVGGTAKTVTVEAGDTLKLLSEKIARASGYTAKAEIVTVDGVQKIKVTSVAKAQIEIEPGKTGRNALAALGLAEGVVTNAPLNPTDAKKAKTIATYGLGMPSSFALDTPDQAKQASQTLLNVAMAVKDIYTNLITPVKSTTKPSAPVPAYLTAQIANYKQALARLGG
jgi:hypothetical protein